MKKLLLVIITLCFSLSVMRVTAQTNVIKTFAGSSPVGKPVLSLGGSVYDAVLDKKGNLYLSGLYNRIWKLSPNGSIALYAGNGPNSYSGDNGPATAAGLYGPGKINIDGNGNIYFMDNGNYVIRKIDTNGIITTIAGNGIKPSFGYYPADNVPATSESLNESLGIAIDSYGNVYFSDGFRIHKININDTLTTIMGKGHTAMKNGLALLADSVYNAEAYSLALDKNNNLFVADANENCVYKINTHDTITALTKMDNQEAFSGDGGPDTAARLGNPMGITTDDTGNIYIADIGNFRIRKIGTNGIINTLFGNSQFQTGEALYTGMNADSVKMNMQFVQVDKAGIIYTYAWNNIVSVNAQHRITVLEGDTIAAPLSPSNGYYGDGGPANQALLSYPYSVAADKKGNVFIGDVGNDLIREVTPNGIISKYITCSGNSFIYGNGYMATDSSKAIFNSMYNYGQALQYANPPAQNGTLCGTYGSQIPDSILAQNAHVSSATGVALDKNWNVYFCDPTDNYILKYYRNKIITIVSGGTNGYAGDGGPARYASISDPTGIVVDSIGDIYFCDAGNYCIRKIDIHGIITTIAGKGISGYAGDGGPAKLAEFGTLTGICLDKTGNIYVADTYNNCVRMINTHDTIVTIAGNGIAGYSGDGGPASVAELWQPTGVCVDTKGILYIADNKNSVVREVCLTPAQPDTIIGASIACQGSIQIYSTHKIANAQGYTWTLPSGWSGTSTDTSITVMIGAVGGNISVSANGSCAISGSKTVPVNVTPAPLSITPSSDAVCAGNSVTLLAGGASSYSWSPSTALNSTSGASVITSPLTSITYTVNATYTNSCVNSDTVTVKVYPSNGFDLTGNLYACIDTPGFRSASIQACIFNNRCQMMKGTMKLVVDTAIHILNIVSDSTVHTSGDTLIWNFDSLSDIGRSYCVALSGMVDSIPAKDSILVSMFISPVTGDSAPSNNSFSYWIKPFPHNCVGLPFDPNGKTVWPIGDIAATQQLTYTIHFQNTGTALAHNVVIVDTLDKNLDASTLVITDKSAPVITTISGSNVVRFSFNNINLPDTLASKTLSKGFIQYSITPVYTISLGTTIVNKAGIYFDNNSPITTNTTNNTVKNVTGVALISSPSLNIACFPNPFTVSTSIVFNTDGKHYLEVNDVTGRTIEKIECTGRQYELSGNNLAKGVYFIKAFNCNKSNVAVTKVVIQ
ncbi:MAG TPA: T9SS type A sorting domain-containing protein [Bacteroidia bacterium]|nr:T9SS type A sorting domain-containing protein [Bacteroidia bacterium]